MHNQDDLGHALQKCLYSSFILIDKTVVHYQSRNKFSFLLFFVNGNLNFQLTIVVCTESGFCRVASMSQKHLSVFERLS